MKIIIFYNVKPQYATKRDTLVLCHGYQFEYMHVLVFDWNALFQRGPSEGQHFLLQSTICPDRSRSSMHIAGKQSFWETPSMEQCGISWTK